MDRERAWARVQTALDERRDPLDDALLCDWFAEHPAELEEYARLERRLDRLAANDTRAASTRTIAYPRRRLLELAATFAATLVLLIAARRGAPEPAAIAPATDLPELRIIDYRLTATRTDGERSFQASRGLNEPLRITNTRITNRSTAPGPGMRWSRPTLETETN